MLKQAFFCLQIQVNEENVARCMKKKICWFLDQIKSLTVCTAGNNVQGFIIIYDILHI